MKAGVLMYVRPANFGCLLYRERTRRGNKAVILAGHRDAQTYAWTHNLLLVQEVKQ